MPVPVVGFRVFRLLLCSLKCNLFWLTQSEKNVETINERVEKVDTRCHFVVTRAVATLSEIYGWTKKNVKKESFNELPNGIICLKGGDLNDEIKQLKVKARVYDLNKFFREEFFIEKKAVHIPCS
jgi:16S rRNA (guanine527-N7)-methyltransferase